MNNFLHKMAALVLLVVGWASGAWAQDASSTAVVEVLDANGNKTEYATFTEALSKAKLGNHGTTWTIKCLTDLEISSELYFTNSAQDMSATLDLNGHKISKDPGYVVIQIGNSSKETPKFKLKITDGAGGGKFSLENVNIFVCAGHEIEFASGTYDVGNITVDGTLTISGGKLSFGNLATRSGDTPQKENINVTGGLIKEGNSSQTLRQFIDEENYTVVQSTNGYYAVVSPNTVAMNYDADGNLSGVYERFGDAMSNATDGTTIRMCGDCEVGNKAEVDEGKSVYLDLNGHALTTSSASFAVRGSLTISDESANQTGKIDASNAYMIRIYENATLNLVSGNFIDKDGILFYNNSGTINIKGGKFSYSSIFVNYQGDASINIYGGFFNKNTGTSINPDDKSGYWTTYIADGFVVIDNSGVNGYPYAVVRGAALTYGDGTTASAAVSNGVLTLDLKDDESDHNAWVSKINATGDIENVDVTVKKNFTNTNWHAFYAPFQINVTSELLQSFDVAKIWDTELNIKDNSTLIEFIQLKDGESIPAFTPCLIKAKATGKQDIEFKNVTVKATTTTATQPIECSNVDEKFTFTGVMENTSITDLYALDSETGNLVQASSETAKVTPMKFYMIAESKSPVTSIKSKRFAVRVIGDEATGISTIDGDNTAKADGAVYNLQGVKMGTSLNGLPAGLYIQNGRKVAVK